MDSFSEKYDLMWGNDFIVFIVSLPVFYRFGEEMRPVKLTTKVFGTCCISKVKILAFYLFLLFKC